MKHKYCKTQKYNLLVVLYGCETWFLTLRKEQSVRALKNSVLGPRGGGGSDRRVKETEQCGALHVRFTKWYYDHQIKKAADG